MSANRTAKRNPYTPPATLPPPKTTLGDRRPGWIWKLYFLFLLAGSVLTYGYYGVAWFQLVDAVDLVPMTLGLLGMFGYIYQRPLLSRVFWRVYLPIQCAWDVVYLFVFDLHFGWACQIPGEAPPTIAALIIGLVGVFPLYLALFRYAFMAHDVWSPQRI